MYGWFFRHLPGPTWFRFFLCLVIAAFAVAVLFAYVFPWAERFFGARGLYCPKLLMGGGAGLPAPPQYIQFRLSALRARSPKQTVCQSEAGLVSLSGLRGWGRPKSHPVTRRE